MPKALTPDEETARAEAARRKAKAMEAKNLQAAKPKTPDQVECRVLPLGDNMISTGEHVEGVGDLTFDRGDVFKAPREIAEGLERRGYVEIQ